MAAAVLKLKSKMSDFEKIVEECAKGKGNWGLLENDILFAVTFWLMTECGFAVVRTGEKYKAADKALPENWKHRTKELYEAQFVLPPYDEHLVRLVALPADDILCINVFVTNVSPRSVHLKSLAISSTGFVPRPEANQVSSKFSNLDHIRLHIKTSLIWPIRCSILTAEGVVNGSLSGLSDEIKLKICSFLEVEDVLALSETCHDLNRICNDQELWKSMFHRHFKLMCKCAGKAKDCEESSPWKEKFKLLYKRNPGTRESEHSSLDSFHTATESPFFDVDLSYD